MIKKSKIEENYVLVDNVIKTFKTNNKKKIILSNVNFQIRKGEFTCMLGQSGLTVGAHLINKSANKQIS